MDNKPGKYSIKGNGGFGHLLILDRDGKSKIYEVISGQFASTESEIQLEEGQTVKITGISMVNFQSS
ncbi:hypothetical protein CIL03_16050 [Virgibacillus indicus]|uniref:Uncharacterized protein n=1 Tax=Virgibacillus indicus TaxID=2024554 RepID=A0A265N718_9BACI|nr:hypothetical protein [Virgibacillus indicus]OZU87601.1 hypothetical protein CIL03_16050 [Virgibacillus indicus]